MILIDAPCRYPPTKGILGGRVSFTSSHLISDIPGKVGTMELKAFAWKIGLRMEWIQYEGAYNEHFDVLNKVYDKAIKTGARLVDRAEILSKMVGKK